MVGVGLRERVSCKEKKGGGWQLVGEDHRNDHLGKRRLDAQIVATGLN